MPAKLHDPVSSVSTSKHTTPFLWERPKRSHLGNVIGPLSSPWNVHLEGVNWYRHHLGQLRTVTAEQTRV